MSPRRKNRQGTPGVLGYTRCSTEEQQTSGLGLKSQRSAIEAECDRRSLPLLAVYEDAGVSGKSLDRPALSEALSALSSGAGTVLMVAKLDRLTRSVHDATGLMERSQREGWGLVALDAPVDTTTPAGAAMAQVLAVFAELERRLIGQRTRDALAVKRQQGVQLGRPQILPAEVVERIVSMRADERMSWSAIARVLDADSVPTAQGGQRWYPATVRSVASAELRKAQQEYDRTWGDARDLDRAPVPKRQAIATTHRLQRAQAMFGVSE